MNRFDLQKMAEERVADAAALLDAGRFQAAYYLCGYAIECALKACIARLTVSGIEKLHDEEAGRNGVFAENWNIVKDWSEVSRYDPAITETRAFGFFLAVTDPTDGVLAWLKTLW
jgi:hypothetical protein